jgi:hypothetical protein
MAEVEGASASAVKHAQPAAAAALGKVGTPAEIAFLEQHARAAVDAHVAAACRDALAAIRARASGSAGPGLALAKQASGLLPAHDRADLHAAAGLGEQLDELLAPAVLVDVRADRPAAEELHEELALDEHALDLDPTEHGEHVRLAGARTSPRTVRRPSTTSERTSSIESATTSPVKTVCAAGFHAVARTEPSTSTPASPGVTSSIDDTTWTPC